MNPNLTQRRHYPALDTLRGIAIVMVLLYHNFSYISLFEFCWLGVDLFFVLSGFLITDILIHTSQTKLFLISFYKRRFLRIFPLYYVCLGLIAWLLPLVIHVPYDVEYYRTNSVWFCSFLQNWFFIIDSPEKYRFLDHFWSLALEEQFYLFWPIAFLILKTIKKRLIFLLLIFLLFSLFRFIIVAQQPFQISYTNLIRFCRIDGLLIGCIVGLIVQCKNSKAKKLILTPAILLEISCVTLLFVSSEHLKLKFFTDLLIFPLASIIFGSIICYSVSRNTHINQRLWIFRILNALAKVSFGLYILHWPIYLWLTPYIKNWLQFSNVSNLNSDILNSILNSTIAVLFSFISYRYFEKPFLSMKDKIAPYL